MSRSYRCALFALVLALGTSPSFAQSAASSAASAAAGMAAPAAPAKAAPAPKKGAGATPKHYLGVLNLPPTVLQFPQQSCFVGQLSVPATNATALAKILGSDDSFTATPVPPDKIAIYGDKNSPSIKDLRAEVTQIGGSSVSATAIRVARGSASRSADKIQAGLPTDGSIVVKAVDRDCILLVAKDDADPIAVAGLKKSIAQFYWGQESSAPTQRLFYADATTVVKKLTGAADSTKDAGGTTAMPSPKTAASTAASSTASPTVSVSVAPGAATAKSTPSDPGGSSPGDASNGSDPAAPTDSTGANSKSTDTTAKPATADKSKTTPPTPKPVTMQAVNDTIVYSNDDGSDRGIFERNRLMAVLDLPRPEVLMNIWSLQASSGSYMTVNAEAEAARELIAHHNDLLQNSINNGWDCLSRQMKLPKFFNQLFYRYITQKFNENEPDVALDPPPSKFEVTVLPGDSKEPLGTIDPLPDSTRLRSIIGMNRGRWGWCDPEKYCLGFSHAFEPLRPTFTNLLIGIISSDDAYSRALDTVDTMEKASGASTQDDVCESLPERPTITAVEAPAKAPAKSPDKSPDKSQRKVCEAVAGANDGCSDPDTITAFRQCIQQADEQMHTFWAQSGHDCELTDRITMSEQILAGQEETLKLDCFREQVQQSFGPPKGKLGQYSTTAAGLMRAAVADFLFNYKWATQYPHDFIPYDLTQSAQELNAEFNPLVLAFNRDVAAFTENLQAELQCKYTADIDKREPKSWFKKDDQTFINDGMLSVRGISGVESVVDTVTQSFFDATNPPSLTDLVKSVSDAEKNIPGVLQTNLTANEAAVLLGALNSVQPAQAKIGRQLSLDITPHALAGASSAELEVKLTAQEMGDPTRFTADKSAEDTLSRVAKHNVNTRVRVESLKLFEVSAFSALLQRPRSKIPILPPLVEVPYFGSFIGWPLAGAKVYHRSTAIVSAVIVPTAADLAFGIDFSADRFCMEDGCHRAHSPQDFGTLPLRNFHKAMVECFASGGQTPYTGLQSPPKGEESKANLAENSCGKLSLLNVSSGVSSGVPPID